MSEEMAQATEQAETEEPHGTEGTTDWKAEARKWETRAKKAHAAEVELEQLKAAQMSDAEKAQARAEKAEAELKELRAKAAHDEAAKEIAVKTGVPAELLAFCYDADAMQEFAKAYEAAKPEPEPIHAAARGYGSKLNNEHGGKTDTRELFKQFAAEQFK